MKHLHLGILTCIIALGLFSCTSGRKSQRPQPNDMPTADTTIIDKSPIMEKKEEVTASTVLSKLNKVSYNTFSGKADVEYSSPKGKSLNFDVKINMQKDELIWLSALGPFNIEVARVLITKDSVQVLNKLQREYLAESISYVQEQLGLPLDLHSLQELIIGNPLFINEQKSSFTDNGNNIITLNSQTDVFTNLLSLLKPQYTVSSSELKDTDGTQNRSAVLLYNDYTSVNDFQFSVKRNISVDYKGKTTIKLKFNNYRFNEEINTPFSVPGNYKKISK
ncbi:MAG: DUF4292 domain-containing protein [Niabella sp.]